MGAPGEEEEGIAGEDEEDEGIAGEDEEEEGSAGSELLHDDCT
jgi:hypothetical protein